MKQCQIQVVVVYVLVGCKHLLVLANDWQQKIEILKYMMHNSHIHILNKQF